MSYNINQPLNPYTNHYTNPQLNTIDNNEEQVRQIVQEENEKLRKERLYRRCVIYMIALFLSFMIFIAVYFGKR